MPKDWPTTERMALMRSQLYEFGKTELSDSADVVLDYTPAKKSGGQ